MDPNKYQQLALEKEANQLDLLEHVYEQGVQGTAFSNGVNGLVNEVGELSDLKKRWLEYRGMKPQPHEILEECGDVLWRTAQVLNAFGLTLEQAMEANIEKLHKVRYKDTVCNPHDAAEENRDRKGEADCVEEVALRRARAEDDGVDYDNENRL